MWSRRWPDIRAIVKRNTGDGAGKQNSMRSFESDNYPAQSCRVPGPEIRRARDCLKKYGGILYESSPKQARE